MINMVVMLVKFRIEVAPENKSNAAQTFEHYNDLFSCHIVITQFQTKE